MGKVVPSDNETVDPMTAIYPQINNSEQFIKIPISSKFLKAYK